MNDDRSIRGQRGQTNVEWLGVMAIVVLIVGAVALASPTVGKSIGCVVLKAVHKVGGGSYTCADPSDTAALPPCVVGDKSGQLKASVTVFSIKGGGQVKITKTQLSDNTWRVTVEGGGEIGIAGGGGGGVTVDTGNSEVGAGDGAKGSITVKGDYGAAWNYKNEGDASDAVDIIRNKLRDGAIDAAVPIAGSIGTSLFGEHRDLGNSDIEYIQGGVAGDVKGDLHGGLTGLNGSASGSAVLGVRWNHQNKTKTVYLQANADGSVEGEFVKKLGLKGDFEGQLAVTYDENGKALDVQVIAKGGIAGQLPTSPTNIKDPSDVGKLVSFTGSASSGLRGEVQMKLDLTNPANSDAFAGFLEGRGSGPLVSQFLDNGRAQVRTYKTGGEDYGFDVSGGEGLEFGVEGSYAGKNSQLIKAWDWDPYNGWHESTTCKV